MSKRFDRNPTPLDEVTPEEAERQAHAAEAQENLEARNQARRQGRAARDGHRARLQAARDDF